MKKTRILKNEWPNFVKNFNRQNQFRRTTLGLGEAKIVDEPGMPLVGLAYDSEERKIDVYLGGTDTKDLAHLSHSVDVPRALYLITDENTYNSVAGLQIQGSPGTSMLFVMFKDEIPENGKTQWISKLAYNLFQTRGEMVYGEDQKDWYEAEKLINETVRSFVE
jgi:hypothetical protein